MALHYRADEILTNARIYLNDVNAQAYTDTKLFPCLKSAYQTIKDEMLQSSVPTVKEVWEELLVSANSTGFDTPPPNLIYPIQLLSRQKGVSTTYVPMKETMWTPDVLPGATLTCWTWRGDAIHFLAATSDCEVMLRYLKDLEDITNTTALIMIANAVSYLSWRTAAIAAATIGEDYDRGKYLETEAEKAKEIWLATAAKNKQGLPSRRRPYKALRNRRYWM